MLQINDYLTDSIAKKYWSEYIKNRNNGLKKEANKYLYKCVDFLTNSDNSIMVENICKDYFKDKVNYIYPLSELYLFMPILFFEKIILPHLLEKINSNDPMGFVFLSGFNKFLLSNTFKQISKNTSIMPEHITVIPLLKKALELSPNSKQIEKMLEMELSELSIRENT